jgi:MFS family permease
MTTTQTAIVTAVAVLMAVAAAIRSTWSPCGLSMLSTITPFGERAKGHRFGVTAGWFIAGAVVGGLGLGALAAVLAVIMTALGLPATAIVAAALAAALVTAVSDTGLARIRLPVHFRQVNERWLDAYRPWVYGAGFGIQIGCGLATYITTAAVYLTVVLAALTGSPLAALVVGTVFGIVRGCAVLLTARVATPTALLAFHQRFAAVRPIADRVVLATLGVVAVALGVACGTATAAVVTAAVAVGTMTVRTIVVHRGRVDGPGDAQTVAAAGRGTGQSESDAPEVAGAGSPSSTGTASAELASASVGGGNGSGVESRQRR